MRRRRGLHVGEIELSSRTLQLVGALGVLAAALGAWLQSKTFVGAVILGLGTSIVASVLVGLIALGRERILQDLLGDGVQELFEDRNTHFENSFWNDLLKETSRHFRVLGTANNGYVSDPSITAATRQGVRDAVIRRDVEVEFLWLNPDHPLAITRQTEEKRSTRRDTCESILEFWGIREDLPPEKKAKLILKEYEATPSCGITWSDDLLVVTQYMAGNPNLHAPGLVLGRSFSWRDLPARLLREHRTQFPPITQRYMANFEAIRLAAKEIESDRIKELRDLYTELDKEAKELGLPSQSELREDSNAESA